ncbi:hypothetical protein D1P53_006299 [Cryptococcus gattii VGV]|nr:hypothetical protein D1P53_006299 [Cryptococcus gattii VGV]
MSYPRPPHTIELVIPHLLTDSQFEMLEDLTFMHFESTLGKSLRLLFPPRKGGMWKTGKRRKELTEKQQEAWPISLKIITELYERITLPLAAAAASPDTPPSAPPSKGECHTTKVEGEADQREGGGGKTKSETTTTTTTTKISVSTSKEWDPANEEAVRRIVRNILVEIMGGGIQIKRA